MTGADRRAYLQGLLTNDIEALTPGTGCYAALLTAQGRMITDMRLVELGEAILIDLPSFVSESVLAHLERFVFSEDVQIRDITAERAEVGLYGPVAGSLVAGVLKSSVDLAAMPLFGCAAVPSQGNDAIVIRSDEAGVDGFDVVLDAAHADAFIAGCRAAGAVDVDADSAETVRIEAGRPLFGIDMDTDTIPLEAGIEDRAISRTKGCYVGQEVIVRVIDRGHGRVARRLVGLQLSSEVARGTKVLAGEREVGRITSVTRSPRVGSWVALGYVQRDFTAPGTSVTIEGTLAVVSDLPFAAAT
jgi:folate-binding protein YgfZ